MRVYIVLDGSRVVGVSARLQGAELIRMEEARRQVPDSAHAADSVSPSTDWWYRRAYARMRIETCEVLDG